MSVRFWRLSLVSIVIVLAATTLVVSSNVQASLPPAQEPEPQVVGQTVTITASPQQQAAALETWTLEARAAAKPMPFPSVSLDANLPVIEEAEENGAAVSIAPGGAPHPRADRVARRQYRKEWRENGSELEIQEALAAPFGTAAIFTSYRGNKFAKMWKQYPYVAVGKLYITGGGYCSASVISPNNIIVTAAHCVWDVAGGGFYPGWTFVPAERNFNAPYGTFPWASATVLTAWTTTGATQYDIAVIALGNNTAGNPVTFYTGWLGRSWDWPYVQHHHAIGYPSNLPKGTKQTYICAAESFSGGTDVLSMGCDMTFGSSGGPWIRHFAPYTVGAVNFVNSVVSGGVPGSDTFSGARFTSGNIVVLCNAIGC
jgi:V8-like Glu-specific endopeptidase